MKSEKKLQLLKPDAAPRGDSSYDKLVSVCGVSQQKTRLTCVERVRQKVHERVPHERAHGERHEQLQRGVLVRAGQQRQHGHGQQPRHRDAEHRAERRQPGRGRDGGQPRHRRHHRVLLLCPLASILEIEDEDLLHLRTIVTVEMLLVMFVIFFYTFPPKCADLCSVVVAVMVTGVVMMVGGCVTMTGPQRNVVSVSRGVITGNCYGEQRGRDQAGQPPPAGGGAGPHGHAAHCSVTCHVSRVTCLHLDSVR